MAARRRLATAPAPIAPPVAQRHKRAAFRVARPDEISPAHLAAWQRWCRSIGTRQASPSAPEGDTTGRGDAPGEAGDGAPAG